MRRPWNRIAICVFVRGTLVPVMLLLVACTSAQTSSAPTETSGDAQPAGHSPRTSSARARPEGTGKFHRVARSRRSWGGRRQLAGTREKREQEERTSVRSQRWLEGRHGGRGRRRRQRLPQPSSVTARGARRPRHRHRHPAADARDVAATRGGARTPTSSRCRPLWTTRGCLTARWISCSWSMCITSSNTRTKSCEHRARVEAGRPARRPSNIAARTRTCRSRRCTR